MKVVIIGGTGRIGSRLASLLEQQGHTVIAASRRTGIDSVSGKGLDEALSGAHVVIDVSNAPGVDADTALKFFETSTNNLIKAEKKNGVSHYVILSIVGVEQMPPEGYFKAKQAQEKLVKNSGIPYTIVQATQFFEFLNDIATHGAKGEAIHVPAVSFQPIAADDVASILASVATGKPANGVIAIAGPQKASMAEIVGEYLEKKGDKRVVQADPDAGYFGIPLEEGSLVPGEGKNIRLGEINLEKWYNEQ